VSGQLQLQPLFTPGKDPEPIAQEARLAPGPVWTGADNLTPSGIRSPDRPARIPSLDRLRYPDHKDLSTFMILSRSILLTMKIISDKCIEIQNAYFRFKNFFFPIIVSLRS